jgi:hypothetical protein
MKAKHIVAKTSAKVSMLVFDLIFLAQFFIEKFQYQVMMVILLLNQDYYQ